MDVWVNVRLSDMDFQDCRICPDNVYARSGLDDRTVGALASEYDRASDIGDCHISARGIEDSDRAFASENNHSVRHTSDARRAYDDTVGRT